MSGAIKISYPESLANSLKLSYKAFEKEIKMSSLVKLSRIDILKELYTEINIPRAVYQEIENGQKKNVWISKRLISEVYKLTEE